MRFQRSFIGALGLIKAAAAKVNGDLGELPPRVAAAVEAAANQVMEGAYDSQFVVDIFQTGSGTSTNMNANEVIGKLAGAHPNDEVNRGQSNGRLEYLAAEREYKDAHTYGDSLNCALAVLLDAIILQENGVKRKIARCVCGESTRRGGCAFRFGFDVTGNAPVADHFGEICVCSEGFTEVIDGFFLHWPNRLLRFHSEAGSAGAARSRSTLIETPTPPSLRTNFYSGGYPAIRGA